MLIEKYKSGIRITLCIKTLKEYSEKYEHLIADFVNEMRREGINIIQLSNNYLKFMVVDNVIVWYGGIDILGEIYNDNSLIRIQDEALANELIGEITEQ